MYPILFQWGPIRIGSYGVLLATAFAAAINLLLHQFRRNGQPPELAWDIALLAMIGGLIGSKTLFILEHFGDFLGNPFHYVFNSAGFSVIGGYALAVALCWWRLRRAGAPFLFFADLTAPSMAVGYAIGRLGCIAAGDGCYGIPSKLPWAMTFPNGLVPTLALQNQQLMRLWQQQYPGEPVPIDIPVHPAPLYESLSASLLVALLLSMTPGRPWTGRRLLVFLGWFGASRFLVEFIRLNPVLGWGLSSDQFLAIGMVLGAIALWMVLPRTATVVVRSEGATGGTADPEAATIGVVPASVVTAGDAHREGEAGPSDDAAGTAPGRLQEQGSNRPIGEQATGRGQPQTATVASQPAGGHAGGGAPQQGVDDPTSRA